MNKLHDRKTCQVIGIPVDIGELTGTSTQLINRIINSEQRGGYVCVANVHMLTVAHQNSKFKSILERSDLVVPDGMPLVWIQKLQGYKTAERVCGPDLMIQLCGLANEFNLSIYLLGSSAKTLTLLSKNLTNQFSKLNIAGMYSPESLPEQPSLDLNLVSKINASGADLLFIGLGCPKQEFWSATHAPYLKPLSIGVGAAFDFHAGVKSRPPAFIQNCGLEWLYRLASEPRRLWKRYLVTNSLFLYYLMKDFLRKK